MCHRALVLSILPQLKHRPFVFLYFQFSILPFHLVNTCREGSWPWNQRQPAKPPSNLSHSHSRPTLLFHHHIALLHHLDSLLCLENYIPWSLVTTGHKSVLAGLLACLGFDFEPDLSRFRGIGNSDAHDQSESDPVCSIISSYSVPYYYWVSSSCAYYSQPLRLGPVRKEKLALLADGNIDPPLRADR